MQRYVLTHDVKKWFRMHAYSQTGVTACRSLFLQSPWHCKGYPNLSVNSDCDSYTLPHLTSPHRTAPHPHRTSPHPTPPHPPPPPHLISPHLTSPHLTSPHLTSRYSSNLCVCVCRSSIGPDQHREGRPHCCRQRPPATYAPAVAHHS